jgi:hypothetical protein
LKAGVNRGHRASIAAGGRTSSRVSSLAAAGLLVSSSK